MNVIPSALGKVSRLGQFFPTLEKTLMTAVLMASSGAFYLRVKSDENLGFFSLLFKSAYFGFGGIVLLLLVLRSRRRPLRSVVPDLWLSTFTIMLFLSVGWASGIGAATGPLQRLALASVSGLYLGLRFSSREQRQIVSNSLIILILFSLGAGLLVPEFGIMQRGSEQALAHKGDWRGVFVHKNILGRFSSFGVIVFSQYFFSGARKGLFSLIWLVLSGASLALSSSSSALVTVMAVLLVTPVLFSIRHGFRVVLMVTALAIPAFVFLAFYLGTHYEEVLGALGRDATLTGRVPLWAACLLHVREKPWFGFGLGGFWPAPEDPTTFSNPGVQIWKMLHFKVSHAHNGIIELLLTVGIVGVLLYSFSFAKAIWDSIHRVARARAARVSWDDSSWGIIFLCFIFVSNLAEAHILDPYWWILYVAVAVTPVLGQDRHDGSIHGT